MEVLLTELLLGPSAKPCGLAANTAVVTRIVRVFTSSSCNRLLAGETAHLQPVRSRRFGPMSPTRPLAAFTLSNDCFLETRLSATGRSAPSNVAVWRQIQTHWRSLPGHATQQPHVAFSEEAW